MQFKYWPMYSFGEIIQCNLNGSLHYGQVTKVIIELDGDGQNVFYRIDTCSDRISEKSIVKPPRKQFPIVTRRGA